MSKTWKSRIVGHDRVDPEQLTGNPKNHRTHPQKQRDVVRDSIAEFGFVKSVLVNKTTGFIVDGHERVWQALDAKQSDPDVVIDVEYVELSEPEEAAVLAILDASTEMAVVDGAKLDELLREVNTKSQAIADMLTELAEEAGSLDVPIDDFGIDKNTKDYLEGSVKTFQFVCEESDFAGVSEAIENSKREESFTTNSEAIVWMLLNFKG